MAGLGVEKLEKLMPEIVATASKVDIAPHVRDGYIMMFNYLPITFGDKFTPYVGPIIPCILKVGASDGAEEGAGGQGTRCHPPKLARGQLPGIHTLSFSKPKRQPGLTACPLHV